MSLCDVYNFFGYSLEEKGNQIKGTCPWCEKESHFFVAKKTAQFHCKSCGEKGNAYSFIARHHEECLNETNTKHYKQLEEAKGVPETVARFHRLAFDQETEDWLVPVFNAKGSLANLKVWRASEGKLLGCPGMSLHLYNLENLQAEGPIFLVEGEWDAMLLNDLLKRGGYENITVLATQGSGNFKKEWIEHLIGREVYLCFDNDNPGAEGMARIVDMVKDRVESIQTIEWPPNFKEKYDIRDFYTENRRRLKTACKEFLMMFLEQETERKPTITRTSLKSVIKDFKNSIEVTKRMEDGVALMFATIFSVRVPGDPIWMFFVAPPGGGKTLILRSTELNSNCIYRSSITPHSLVSGFRAEGGDDPSLIPQAQGKCLIIKDYTEVKSLPQGIQEEIYGVLRGAYDGRVEKTFGNGITRIYPNCHFSLLAGVTNIIHADDRATLGERFLKYTLIEKEDSHENQLRAAINNTITQRVAENELHESAHAFLYHLWDYDVSVMPKVPSWIVDRLVGLAQVVAFLRASVDRRNGELMYRPEPEVGTRLSKQLAKLLQCLAVVNGNTSVGKEEWRIAEIVAFETATGWFQDIMFELAKNPGGLTVNEIAERAEITRATTQRRVEDLLQLKAIYRIERRDDEPGRPEYVYRFTSRFQKLWDAAKLQEYVNSHDPKKKYSRRRTK